MKIIIKKIKVPASKRYGTPAIKKEVAFLIGRGDNCECSDCPVLYGGDCPYDNPPTL